MATASFKLDTRDMVRLITKVRERAPRAIARAINKSAKSTKTAMVKAVREDMGLKAKDVRDGLVLRQARPGRNPTARIIVSKKPIPLIAFGGTQLKRAGWRSRMKGGARTYPGAFKATMQSGDVGVFRLDKERAKTNTGRDRRGRLKRGRLPIFELHGPSLAKVFAKKWRVGVKRYRQQLAKNLKSEIRFASRGR